MRYLVTSLLALTALPATAMELQSLTYDLFEYAVPHVDLEACPETQAAPGTFCRATLANDAIHVFAFSEDGDQPLVSMESYDGEDLGGALGQ